MIFWKIAGRNLWRNRRRIEFHVISANCYYQPWTSWDLDQSVDWPGPPGTRPAMKPGDWRKAFVVVEVVVKNEYPTEVSVGRFVIDGWMFADRFTPGMYAWKRDYRAFDLYTQQSTSLEAYNQIRPKGALGIRVEVIEETEGPGWQSSKSRYVVERKGHYDIQFRTDFGNVRKRIKFSRPKKEYSGFNLVHHWSDLIELPQWGFGAAGAPVPQGVAVRPTRPPLLRRIKWAIRNRYRRQVSLLLYGVPYRFQGEPNRFWVLRDRVGAMLKERLDIIKR